MIQNEKVSVYYGTKEAYEFEKQYKRIDENALYFIEGVIYSGYELYSKDYEKVSELPDVGENNIIYINTSDSSVSIWNEDKSEWIYICKPISDEIVDDSTTIASSAVVYKTLREAKNYTDEKCIETINTVNATIENSIMENNRNLFLGTSDKYNSIADICDALDATDIENVYTKDEVDNKFSAFETNIDWKESVATYNDILTTYLNPVDGWTVNVKDTDVTYRYNGSQWIAISANAIPKATEDIDGLFSKEGYSKLLGIANGAEVNQNAFSNVIIGSDTLVANNKTDAVTLVAGDNVTITADKNSNRITISSINTDTKYSPGTGISLDGTTFNNSGVRSIATGGTNGTILVDTNGTNAEVAVKGLGSAAYTSSSDYAVAGHTHSTIKLGNYSATISSTGDLVIDGGIITNGSGGSELTGDLQVFGDITATNFYGLVANLTTTTKGYALDATMGKSLKDSIDTLNSNFSAQLGSNFVKVYDFQSNGFDLSTIIGSNYGIHIIRVAETAKPSIGIPDEVNNWGALVVFNCMYKQILYISQHGEIATYGADTRKWKVATMTDGTTS